MGDVQKSNSPSYTKLAMIKGAGLQLPTGKALVESCKWQASKC